jgi:hypothetical protein
MADVTVDDVGRELKGLGQQGQDIVWAYLKAQEARTAALETAFAALTTKLDLDAGVTDEDYNTLDPA